MLDYLIIGLGLSGTAIAHQLEKQPKTFHVINDDSQRASKVAGGLYNPVVLKKFTLAWEANTQLELAVPFYKELETKLGVTLLRPIAVHRKFNSIQEQNNWFSAMDKPGLSPFLAPDLIESHQNISSDYRFGQVLETGLLDTKKMLSEYAAYLKGKGQFSKEQFDYNLLQIEPNGVQYKNIRAKQLIFCEGFGMKKNPFFNYLPLLGNKGEYLIIEAPDLKLKEVIKGTFFLLPMGNDRYKVGATYERDFNDQSPTTTARNKIVQKLDAMIKCEYTIVDQVAGIRPTVPDRKPLVGRHPRYKNMYLCNGFGSRGVLAAPTISQQLLAYIEAGKLLPPAIDIKRFLPASA